MKDEGTAMVDYPPGWTCERTLLRLEYYLLGTLPREESLAIAEHLEACEGCPMHLELHRLTVTTRRG
ncbi:MAG TPA: zf-HC2 domain-containing protein [Gemmatimonadales bacterium]